MSIKHIRYFLAFIPVFLAFGYTRGQNAWEPVQTVEAVCQQYPERMDLLLRSMDLNAAGLSQVKEAFDQGNIAMACRHLLAYYRKGGTAQFFRRDLPAVSQDVNAEADSIVQHIFTFYNQADKVPLDSAGHLDWGYRGPADDIEWAWALNRHNHLRILLKSWFETGNPKYAETIDRHLQDWVISSLPYPGVKSNTAMWRGLEVSLRVEVWAQIFFGLITSEYFTPATQLLMLSSLPEHTHYMQHFHARDGNWLTMEMSGLAMVATAWPEFKSAPAWLDYAKSSMIEGLKDQVYPDGVQKELTSHYHQVALNNFNQFRDVCLRAKESLPEFYNAYLENMQDYIAYSVKPDGYGVLNNDSDRKYNREWIKKAASEYNREDWLFIASNGKNGKRPPATSSRVFPWAGQMISRSGYEPDAQWSFFDIGPWGTGHQHNDKLHIAVSAYGRDLLVDAGRFAYRGKVADKFRKYAQGSEGHNLILIDGQGQGPGPRDVTEPLSDSNYKITERFDYAWNSFDQFKGLEGEGKHTRALFYVRGKFWVVVDRIDTDRPRKIETLWHWHPDCKIKTGDDHIVSTENQKGNLEIIPVGAMNWNVRQVKGQEKPSPQGWYSDQYNDVEPNTASIFSAEIKTDTAFAWILYPSEGASPKIETEILSRLSDGVVVRVKDETGDQWDITVPFSNSAKAACILSSQGRN